MWRRQTWRPIRQLTMSSNSWRQQKHGSHMWRSVGCTCGPHETSAMSTNRLTSAKTRRPAVTSAKTWRPAVTSAKTWRPAVTPAKTWRPAVTSPKAWRPAVTSAKTWRPVVTSANFSKGCIWMSSSIEPRPAEVRHACWRAPYRSRVTCTAASL